MAGTKTYTFTISGTEVSATSTTGRLVGTASGSALGTWYAEVIHDPLGASADIRPGGSFGMALHQAEPAYLVSGQFSRGTIAVKNSGANCTNQVYKVDGYLRDVSGQQQRDALQPQPGPAGGRLPQLPDLLASARSACWPTPGSRWSTTRWPT